jgi:hypothetical protein
MCPENDILAPYVGLLGQGESEKAVAAQTVRDQKAKRCVGCRGFVEDWHVARFLIRSVKNGWFRLYHVSTVFVWLVLGLCYFNARVIGDSQACHQVVLSLNALIFGCIAYTAGYAKHSENEPLS